MSTRRGSQHRRQRSSGGSWAVLRCPCCAEDNVVWIPDGNAPVDEHGGRLYPQHVVLMPRGRIGVRWSHEFPGDDRVVEVLRTSPIAGTTEGHHQP